MKSFLIDWLIISKHKSGIMHNKQNVFLSIIILILFGCAAPGAKKARMKGANQRQMSPQQIENTRRQHYVNSHPNLSEEIRQSILNGVIRIGMTREMVLAAFGDPDNVQRSGDSSGVREVWVYYAPLPEPDSSSLAGLSPADIASVYSIALSKRKATYLFFLNDVFTSFQEK